jgi:hypothetical protein
MSGIGEGLDMRNCFVLLLCLLVCVAGQPAYGQAKNDKPEVEVELRQEPVERLKGTLLEWDETGVTLQMGEEERAIPWLEMTAQGAFKLRQRLVDRTNAEQLFALGEMGRSMGIDKPASAAIEQAVRRDPSLRERADLILQKKPGWALEVPKPAPAEALPGELLVPAGGGDAPVEVYRETTPEEDAAAIEFARLRTKEVEQKLNLKLAEFQTPHFIVFTDWHKKEYDFLEKNLEGAYRAVAKMFDEDPKENVFEGKLAIYMFARQADFQRFGNEFSGWPGGQVPNTLAGYFTIHGRMIHMAMWKPDLRNAGGSRQIAELQWAYVLAHEFVHAFTYRRKTSRMPPIWVAEGIAEAAAMKIFPIMSDYGQARAIMQATPSLRAYWNNEMLQRRSESYAINRTLIETLLAKDKKAFIKWFDAMKAGDDPEAALKKHYNWTFDDLERYWRRYVDAVSRSR